MSETIEPEATHDVEPEPDDELDGCELDFTQNPTSDDEIAGFLASPPGPMKAKSEAEWEQEEES